MEDTMSDNLPDSDLLHSLSNQMADAVAQAGNALVTVNGRPRQPASGIVYAADLILTADHVLERDEDLSIETPDGRSLPAQLVGRDPTTDLAVLRVNSLGLPSIATVSEPARVGQFVLAVGRPASGGPMASLGIISAVGGPLRTRRGGVIEQFLQTDATPYPGFSGGPLIDGRGAAVGVLTTGFGGAALGIPIAIALRVANTLAQHGAIKRGFLGISSQPVQLPEGQRAGLSQETGLLVVRVENGSPAARGGLMVGDLLVSFDGQPLHDTEDLQALLSGERVGKSLAVGVIRGGQLISTQVTVGERK
jgi:S1-C subfamily serine protease